MSIILDDSLSSQKLGKTKSFPSKFEQPDNKRTTDSASAFICFPLVREHITPLLLCPIRQLVIDHSHSHQNKGHSHNQTDRELRYRELVISLPNPLSISPNVSIVFIVFERKQHIQRNIEQRKNGGE